MKYLRPVKVNETSNKVNRGNPLTLSNLMEVDLTPNKPVGPMTRLALKNREAGTLSAAGAKSLENAKRSDAMTASQRGSKFPGKRVRTNPKARLKPSTGGAGPNRPGGLAGSRESEISRAGDEQ